MKSPREAKERPFHLNDPTFSDTGGLVKTGVISLFLHLALVGILVLSLKTAPQSMATLYRVTLRPFSPPGDGMPKGGSGPGGPGPSGGLPSPPAVEKPKPAEKPRLAEKPKPAEKPKAAEKPKGDEIIGRVESQRKKAREESETGERLVKEKGISKSLQEAIEDIHRRAALDEIQKKVALREKRGRSSAEGQSVGEEPGRGPIGPASKSLVPSGAGTGPGKGSGTGGFSGGEGAPGGASGGGSLLESKLNDYYGTLWAKIKKEWTLPENLSKGAKNLETVVVVIINREGKVQKAWFEKRSGSALYDQMAMRAVKKAEPFPPIPAEFVDRTFEIGIRFHPD